MLAKAGNVKIKVENISLKELPLLINLKILTILIILSTRKAVPIVLKIYRISKTRPTIVTKSTTKSKILKDSLKKTFPRAIIFKSCSKKKIPKKARFP